MKLSREEKITLVAACSHALAATKFDARVQAKYANLRKKGEQALRNEGR